MKLYDQSLDELIIIAEQMVYSGDNQKAIKLLESGLLDEPGYSKLHYTLGWIYHYYVENNGLAERHYQLAIYFDPEYKEAYEYLAYLYYQNKKMKGLKVLMNKALKVSSVDQDFVNSMLGKVAESEGDFVGALRYYRNALIICMNNVQAKELKQNIKRAKFKRLKKTFRKWQLIN